MEEIWKDVVGYEGLYQVSNTGKVKSIDWNHSGVAKELTAYEQRGYKLVGIQRNGTRHNYLVHRLVATAFIDNPEGKPDVNHIDGKKDNNCVDNLEWVTKSENTRHAIRTGLRPPTCDFERKRGAEHPCSKPVDQYDVSGNIIRHWACVQDIYSELGYRKSCVRRVCNGYRKTYRGYKWKYTKSGSNSR